MAQPQLLGLLHIGNRDTVNAVTEERADCSAVIPGDDNQLVDAACNECLKDMCEERFASYRGPPLGFAAVSGRSRVPSPAAGTTPITATASCREYLNLPPVNALQNRTLFWRVNVFTTRGVGDDYC